MRINTRTLFIIVASLYIFALAIPFQFFKFEGKEVANVSISAFDVHLEVIYAGLQAILGFTFGLYISNFQKFEDQLAAQTENEFSNNFSKTVFIITIVFAACLIAIFCRDELFASIQGYTDAWMVAFDASLFGVLMQSITISAALILALSLSRKKYTLSVVCGSILLLFVFLMNDKNPFLLFCLALGAGFGYFKRMLTTKLAILFIIGSAFLLIFVKGFSYYQGGEDIVSAMQLGYQNFDITSIDPAGPYLAIALAFSRPSEYLLGLSYWLDIQNILPKFIYPDRLPTMSVVFAETYIDDYLPGKGFGFSPIAEAYMNFGLNGIILEFVIVGIFWGALWRSLRRSLGTALRLSGFDFLLLYQVIGYYFIFMAFRSSAFSFIKMSIQIFLPFIAVSLFLRFIGFYGKVTNLQITQLKQS